jgi:hypothetical protein
MNAEEFRQKVSNTPKFFPLFKLARPPAWTKLHGINAGELMVVRDGSVYSPRLRSTYIISPSYFEFVKYIDQKELDAIFEIS